MESVLPILIWGGLFVLMMRFGCGSHMFGHGAWHKKESGPGGMGGCCGTGETKRAQDPASSQQLRWEAPEKDTDPVCGEIVSPAKAKSSVHDGQVYYFCSRECREAFEYFCSRECREAFEVLPDQYVGQGNSQEVHRLDHSPNHGGTRARHRAP